MSHEAFPIIRLDNVSMMRDTKTVLSNVDLTVFNGDFIAITGPNGGGKTTLLRIILKLITPTFGSVTYLNSQGEAVKRLKIGYLPQKNMIDSHFPVTVADVIASGMLTVDTLSRQERYQRVNDIIHTVRLEEFANQSIGRLSGGQLQRALLGRAIISNPQVLVLDEPLSYLDKTFEHHIYHLLEEYAQKCTIILVSHEMSTIASMANRHIIVDHSLHICASGSHMVHYDCEG